MASLPPMPPQPTLPVQYTAPQFTNNNFGSFATPSMQAGLNDSHPSALFDPNAPVAQDTNGQKWVVPDLPVTDAHPNQQLGGAQEVDERQVIRSHITNLRYKSAHRWHPGMPTTATSHSSHPDGTVNNANSGSSGGLDNAIYRNTPNTALHNSPLRVPKATQAPTVEKKSNNNQRFGYLTFGSGG